MTMAAGGQKEAWTTTFSGLIVAALTPMRGDRSVDLEAIDPYVEFLISHGADALMVLGTTGEYIALSPAERGAVGARFLAAVAGRVPVIVHVGHVDLRVARGLAAAAIEAGADAIAAIVPYYHHVTPDATEVHLRDLARDFSGCSFFVYNYPDAAGNRIECDGFRRLLTEPNVRGIKLSVGTWAEVEPFLTCPREILVTCGTDLLMERFVASGGRAIVSGNAAAFPDALALAWAAFHGQDPHAVRLSRALVQAVAKLSLAGSPDRLKELLAARKVSVGASRIQTFTAADAGPVRELEARIEDQIAELAALVRSPAQT